VNWSQRSRSIFVALAIAMVAGVSVTGPAAVATNATQFIWPTSGRITQPYGCTGFTAEPRLGSCRHFHGGIDIANSRGTPIRAAAPGVVTRVGRDPWGTGAWVVFINHGQGITSWYVHMRAKQIPGIRVGARVRRGQIIGYMDMTGQATGVHLHWSLLRAGHWVNPKSYVNGLPYRPRNGGGGSNGASCDQVWIASVPGEMTAAVTEANDGAGSDTICPTSA